MIKQEIQSKRLVMALTNGEDWVLDPYSGVGSALIAAVKHKRRAVGYDNEAEYIKISKQRLKDFYAGRLRIRELGKEFLFRRGGRYPYSIPFDMLTNKIFR